MADLGCRGQEWYSDVGQPALIQARDINGDGLMTCQKYSFGYIKQRHVTARPILHFQGYLISHFIRLADRAWVAPVV
jgi:hypothetical protein